MITLHDATGVGLVIMNNYICYIIIVNFAVFHLFQCPKYVLFNKSISSIASSVQKKTAQEMTKESNMYKTLKLENYP